MRKAGCAEPSVARTAARVPQQERCASTVCSLGACTAPGLYNRSIYLTAPRAAQCSVGSPAASRVQRVRPELRKGQAPGLGARVKWKGHPRNAEGRTTLEIDMAVSGHVLSECRNALHIQLATARATLKSQDMCCGERRCAMPTACACDDCFCKRTICWLSLAGGTVKQW